MKRIKIDIDIDVLLKVEAKQNLSDKKTKMFAKNKNKLLFKICHSK